jgi:hypothetical protein
MMNISQRRNVTTMSQCHIVTNVSHRRNVMTISLCRILTNVPIVTM